MNLKAIEKETFKGCSSLKDIVIPDSVSSMGMSAFEGCVSLESIYLGMNIKPHARWVLKGCKNITSVEWNIINGSDVNISPLFGTLDTSDDLRPNITSFTIGKDVKSLPSDLFVGMKNLQSVTWKAKRFENFSFESSIKQRLTNFHFGDSVEYIPTNLCKDMTALESIKIPNSVTEMGISAFEGCTKMRTLHIGDGITSFPAKAFAGCTGLINLTVRAEMPPYVEVNTFENVSKTLLVHVPCTSVGYYKAAYYWNEFTNYQESFLLDFLVKPADPEQGSTLIIQHPTCQNITAIFKAMPNNGYMFVEWNDGNKDNPRTEYISEDIEYVATFAPIDNAIEDIVVENTSSAARKVFENGTIYILRNGEKYTIDGLRVM